MDHEYRPTPGIHLKVYLQIVDIQDGNCPHGILVPSWEYKLARVSSEAE